VKQDCVSLLIRKTPTKRRHRAPSELAEPSTDFCHKRARTAPAQAVRSDPLTSNGHLEGLSSALGLLYSQFRQGYGMIGDGMKDGNVDIRCIKESNEETLLSQLAARKR
jgi:hypothetical protein